MKWAANLHRRANRSLFPQVFCIWSPSGCRSGVSGSLEIAVRFGASQVSLRLYTRASARVCERALRAVTKCSRTGWETHTRCISEPVPRNSAGPAPCEFLSRVTVVCKRRDAVKVLHYPRLTDAAFPRDRESGEFLLTSLTSYWYLVAQNQKPLGFDSLGNRIPCANSANERCN